MSSRTQKKRRPTLQIVLLFIGIISLAGCASTPVSEDEVVHASSGSEAKTLRYVKSINVVGLGSNDIIKRFIAGNDSHDLKKPVAIDVRDDVMIIAENGKVGVFAGTHMKNPSTHIGLVQTTMDDEAAGIIFKYDLKTNRMSALIGAGDIIQGDIGDVYLAKDLSFYVTDIDGRQVLHFGPNGSLLETYKHPPNLFRPIAVTVDEEKNEVLVADETYSHIVAFNKGNPQEPIYGMGGRGQGPGKFRIITDMIAVPDGFLVGDRIELRVQLLDRQGNYVTDFGEGIITFPTALAMDNEGRIFVSEKADSTIKVFKAGKLIDVVGRNGYGAGEFRYISDMKVYDNKLYVVDNLNGRIQVFEFIPESQRVAVAK